MVIGLARSFREIVEKPWKLKALRGLSLGGGGRLTLRERVNSVLSDFRVMAGFADETHGP
jgi:hypothetical protein